MSKGQAYRRALIDLLGDVSSSSGEDSRFNWIIRAMSMEAWLDFMRECVDSAIQGMYSPC